MVQQWGPSLPYGLLSFSLCYLLCNYFLYYKQVLQIHSAEMLLEVALFGWGNLKKKKKISPSPPPFCVRMENTAVLLLFQSCRLRFIFELTFSLGLLSWAYVSLLPTLYAKHLKPDLSCPSAQLNPSQLRLPVTATFSFSINIIIIIFVCPLAARREMWPWWCLFRAVLQISSYPFTSSPFILPLASPSMLSRASHTSSLLKPFVSCFCFLAVSRSLFTFSLDHSWRHRPSLTHALFKQAPSFALPQEEFLPDVGNVDWFTAHKSL